MAAGLERRVREAHNNLIYLGKTVAEAHENYLLPEVDITNIGENKQEPAKKARALRQTREHIDRILNQLTGEHKAYLKENWDEQPSKEVADLLNPKQEGGLSAQNLYFSSRTRRALAEHIQKNLGLVEAIALRKGVELPSDSGKIKARLQKMMREIKAHPERFTH